MGSRALLLPKEREEVTEHPSEDKKDVLVKLIDVSVQESFFLSRMMAGKYEPRYFSCRGRRVKKSSLSKTMAWGILWTKVQAKPSVGITLRSLKATRISAIYGMDPSCFLGQGASTQPFLRQHLFYRIFLLAGAGFAELAVW